ncbi:hypothetical protein FQN60_007302 [Etheostoma spectabile]|uniref:Uncharacterized protein n=1 Tax=Etheostoma spectabile TaxID=54343 RepID=A0A5J5CFM3_9PERO|nr:hypothetical protein FQN60_007302 [Etheostoma spectabile]
MFCWATVCQACDTDSATVDAVVRSPPLMHVRPRDALWDILVALHINNIGPGARLLQAYTFYPLASPVPREWFHPDGLADIQLRQIFSRSVIGQFCRLAFQTQFAWYINNDPGQQQLVRHRESISRSLLPCPSLAPSFPVLLSPSLSLSRSLIPCPSRSLLPSPFCSLVPSSPVPLLSPLLSFGTPLGLHPQCSLVPSASVPRVLVPLLLVPVFLSPGFPVPRPPLSRSCAGVLSQQLLRWTQKHQHHCDVITRTGCLSMTYQLLSNAQSSSVLRLFQQSVCPALGVTRQMECIQDHMRDLRRFDCIKKAIARQQHIVLVPAQLGC